VYYHVFRVPAPFFMSLIGADPERNANDKEYESRLKPTRSQHPGLRRRRGSGEKEVSAGARAWRQQDEQQEDLK
jgi:hypothetical protein